MLSLLTLKMKKIFLFIILIPFLTQGQIKELRILYFEVGKNNKLAQKLIDKTEAEFEKNFTVKAYRGAAFTILAGTLKNPFEKLSKFNAGKKLLEEAISQDQKNIELRFLRFSVQCECPKFLKYSDNIDEDKKLILDNFKTSTLLKEDLVFKNNIKDYLLKAACTTENDRKSL